MGRPRKPPEQRARNLHVRLPPEDFARLERLCDLGASGKLSQSSVIAEALELLESKRG